MRAETLARIYGAVRARLPPDLTAYYNGSIEIDDEFKRQLYESVVALY